MIHEALDKLIKDEDLSRAEAQAAMEQILSGHASTEQIAALLVALRIKGETVDEVVGFALAMRRHATPIFPAGRNHPDEVIVDTCGTGGDARGTFNISTAVAFVVAGAGVRVAKHGNRSTGSRCGSADVLEALGMKIELPPERVAESIEQIGIGFLYAPAMHAATRYAIPARRELRVRTVFNLLGPLTNPAGASAQIVGVYDASVTELVAQVLGELGVQRALVVHGADGLDEISIGGETSSGGRHALLRIKSTETKRVVALYERIIYAATCKCFQDCRVCRAARASAIDRNAERLFCDCAGNIIQLHGEIIRLRGASGRSARTCGSSSKRNCAKTCNGESNSRGQISRSDAPVERR